MNMSNSADMTTVGGRSANNSFGALSGKSMGESHWASRSCETHLNIFDGIGLPLHCFSFLSKSFPAGPHAGHIEALLLRHGFGGGGEKVVGQHWYYRQSQLYLKRNIHLRGVGFLELHGTKFSNKYAIFAKWSDCVYKFLLSCASFSPVRFDRAWPGARGRTCKHTCSHHH